MDNLKQVVDYTPRGVNMVNMYWVDCFEFRASGMGPLASTVRGYNAKFPTKKNLLFLAKFSGIKII